MSSGLMRTGLMRGPRFGLTASMLREHRWSYAGLAAVVVAASTVVGSSFILFATARTSDINLAGLSSNEAAKLIGLAESGRTISSFMAFLGTCVAVLLVSQTMGFVVDGRRQEIALLRLAGASPGQTTRMIVAESTVLGIACSIAGVLVAIPLAPPYAAILTRQNNWPPDFPVTIHASALIGSVVVISLVTVTGALLAARRIGRSAPIEAVRAVADVRRNMPLGRWALATAGLVGVAVLLLVPPQSLNYQVTAAGVGVGAVLLVTAVAPVVVPAIARLCGRLVALAAPGAGLVASEHTAHDARRTAALATPIIVLLGLGSVFGMMAQTGRSEKALGLAALTHTDAVVEFTTRGPTRSTFTAATKLPEVAAITQIVRADGWAWADAGMPPDDYPQLMGIAPDTFTYFVPAEFREGTIDDISGTNVAVLTGVGDVGDVFTLEAPDGSTVAVRVAAVVEATSFIYGTFLVDTDGISLETGVTADSWLLESAEGSEDEAGATQLVAALDESIPTGQAFTHREWLDATVSRSVASQQAAILTIVGGAAILAFFALAQSTLTSVRERRAELRLLTNIGARPRSVIGAIVLESSITAFTASLLAAVVTGLVAARMTATLAAVSPGLFPIIPAGLLGAVLALCVSVSILSATVGALLVLHRIRKSR